MVSNIFYFHPYLGKWSNLTNIFQLGWNHQLEKDDFPASYVGFLQRVFPSHQLESIPPGQWSLCIPSLCWKSKELSKCKKNLWMGCFFKVIQFSGSRMSPTIYIYIYTMTYIYIYIYFFLEICILWALLSLNLQSLGICFLLFGLFLWMSSNYILLPFNGERNLKNHSIEKENHRTHPPPWLLGSTLRIIAP